MLKHATQTLLCAERLSEGFAAAGLPAGVFQHVAATHDDVATMIADPRIDFVVFTGSVEGGRTSSSGAPANGSSAPGSSSAARIRRTCAPTADLAYAIGENVDGSFFNSGQSCCAIERIYVHADVYDEFVEGFVEATRGYVLGNPLDEDTTIGPMVTAACRRGRARPGRRRHRGRRPCAGVRGRLPGVGAGHAYMGPTVLVDVDHSMRVMTEESFGPVIGIMKVHSDDEAVRLMNDSEYGLTASVWTSDIEAAIAIGDQVATGTAYMNRCDYVDPALVWTGVKDTGRGHGPQRPRLRRLHAAQVLPPEDGV